MSLERVRTHFSNTCIEGVNKLIVEEMFHIIYEKEQYREK